MGVILGGLFLLLYFTSSIVVLPLWLLPRWVAFTILIWQVFYLFAYSIAIFPVQMTLIRLLEEAAAAVGPNDKKAIRSAPPSREVH